MTDKQITPFHIQQKAVQHMMYRLLYLTICLTREIDMKFIYAEYNMYHNSGDVYKERFRLCLSLFLNYILRILLLI